MKLLNAVKEAVTRSVRLPGDRGRVWLLAATVALDLLRRSRSGLLAVVGFDADPPVAWS
ncbi:MAG: hypothetical protein ACR2K2_13800 [Mycobacteriales bacterium]